MWRCERERTRLRNGRPSNQPGAREPPPVALTNGGTQSQTTGTLCLFGRCNVTGSTTNPLCSATDSQQVSKKVLNEPNSFVNSCEGELLP